MRRTLVNSCALDNTTMDLSSHVPCIYHEYYNLNAIYIFKKIFLIMFASNRWRMKIQTEQNKPHRYWTSITQEFTISFTIIIFGVTIVYIGKNSNAWDMNSNTPSGYDCI